LYIVNESLCKLTHLGVFSVVGLRANIKCYYRLGIYIYTKLANHIFLGMISAVHFECRDKQS